MEWLAATRMVLQKCTDYVGFTKFKGELGDNTDQPEHSYRFLCVLLHAKVCKICLYIDI